MESILEELEREASSAQVHRTRRDELVVEATRKGHSRREVAKAAGFRSPNAVQTILRRAGLLALLALVVSSAAADRASANQPRLAHMQTIAAAFYPGALTNCPHGIVVWTGPPPSGTTEATAGGWAMRSTCEIHLAVGWEAAERGQLCALVVHEYGHLAGLEHDSDPLSPMNAGTLNPGSIPRCAALALAEASLTTVEFRLGVARDRLADARRRHRRRAVIRSRRARVEMYRTQIPDLVAAVGP